MPQWGAIILAGGLGTGAWPFCGIRQKTTLPVAHTPLVRRLALQLSARGVKALVVVTGHRAAAVRACTADIEGVRFVSQGAAADPVEAALAGLPPLESAGAGQVLVCCGDIATTPRVLDQIILAQEQHPRDASLLAMEAPDNGRQGTRLIARNDTLEAVRARAGGDGLAFAGVMAAPPALLRLALERNPGIMEGVGIGAMPPPEGDLAYSFDPLAREGAAVQVVRARDFVVDVDRPWDLVEANRRALDHQFAGMERTHIAAGARVSDGADIAEGTRLWLEPGAEIGKNCVVQGPLWLGKNALLRSGAIAGSHVSVGPGGRIEEYGKVQRGSVVGENSIVGHCAEFHGVAMDTVYLYHYCSVAGLIGTHVDIGAATVCGTWRFDDNTREQPMGRHQETPARHGQFTYIGDYSRTGVNVMFMPGVKVGYHCCVGPGVILREDLPEGKLILAEQSQHVVEWGPDRYAW